MKKQEREVERLKKVLLCRAHILHSFLLLFCSSRRVPSSNFHSYNDESRLSRLGTGASQCAPKCATKSKRTRALSAEYRHAFLLHRSTSLDLFFRLLLPSLLLLFPLSSNVFLISPFPLISPNYRPPCRRRRRTRPPRPLPSLRFPLLLRQRLRLAARRSPRRSPSPSPSGPPPCCLPGPRLRKVCLDCGENVHGDRN